MVRLKAAMSQVVAAGERTPLYWLVLLASAPALALVGWISHYAINVPTGDEWAMVPIFEKWHNHQLTFGDLYRQHNEHRILVPRLIYLAFAKLTHWNLRAEMFFSVALCAATSAGIYVLLRRTTGGPARRLLLLCAAANLLIFSPMQAQNWVWGFQLPMFISNLCLVMTLVLLSSDLRWWPRFAGSVLLIALATFSFGNGLLLWPVIALFLVVRGESKWRVAAWLLVSAGAIALYFHGYYRVPAPQPATGDWLDYPAYFLVFLGGALVRPREGQGLVTVLVAGAVAVALYGMALVHFLRRRGTALRNAAPWLALGPYVLGSAALTAYARVNWGPKQAMESRYVTCSSYLYLGLLALALIGIREYEQRGGRAARVLRATGAAIIMSIVVLTLGGFCAGLDEMAALHRQRVAGLGALEFSKVIDTTESLRRDLSMIPGFAPVPLESVAALERLHLSHYRRRGSAALEDARDRPARNPGEYGETDASSQPDPRTVEMSGWAILPESHRPADLVALAYRVGDRWNAFALCDVGEFREDVAAKLGSRDYLASGWRKRFNRQSLPARGDQVSAWAIDPLAHKVHRLAGDFPLPKISSEGVPGTVP